MKQSLNTILYGPPGTGKTYNTADYAVAIIEGKPVEDIQQENHDEVHKRFLDYKEQKRIAFTTFHQSYGYEDFIEGIRPVLDNDSETVGYQRHNGIFKEFCDSAKQKPVSGFDACYSRLLQDLSESDKPLELHTANGSPFRISANSKGNLTLFTGENTIPMGVLTKDNFLHLLSDERSVVFRKGYYAGVLNYLRNQYGLSDDIEMEALQSANDAVWKVSLAGSLVSGDVEKNRKVHEECFRDGVIRIGWDNYGSLSGKKRSLANLTNGGTILNSFIRRAQIGDIVISLFSKNEIDAIGVITGEYEWMGDKYEEYKRVRSVHWIAKGLKLDIRSINQNKPLFEVTFYKTKIKKSDLVSLLAAQYAKGTAAEGQSASDAPPFVFVIDEINRGNISKIFGELITLVEPSKRLGAVEETKAKLPYSGDEFGVPSNVYILGTMNTADRSIALLDTALRRRFEFIEMMPRPELLADIHVGDTGINLEMMLRAMNDRIEFLLDREHTIGHAYFLGDFKDHPTLAGLAEIFRNKIVPLLQEYFFDDYSKIRLVLGDNGKKETAVQFFNEKKPDDVFFGNAEDAVDPDRCVYRINKEAFDNPAAYIGIYDDGKTA